MWAIGGPELYPTSSLPPWSAKTPSELILLDFWVFGLHDFDMKILLLMVAVQSLNLLAFTWFNREAWIRILALRQQLNIYKRKSKKPVLRNRDRLFWSVLSKLWGDWTSELILVKPETVIRWRKRKFREFWRRKSLGASSSRLELASQAPCARYLLLLGQAPSDLRH